MKELLSFSGLLLWLWLFPMEGMLLSELGIERSINYFLTTHSMTLLAFLWLKKDFIDRYSNFLILITGFLTIFFPYFKDHFFIVLFVLGVSSAFLVLKAVKSLINLQNPLLYSAFGFSIASLSQFVFCRWQISLNLKFFIVGLLPLLALIPKEIKDYELAYPATDKRYTPFIYFFYLTGGILYSFITPAYEKACFFKGFEVFYYIAGCFIGYLVLKFDNIFCLFGAIISGLLAFSFHKVDESLFYNLSMFLLQFAFGMIEIFIMNHVFQQRPLQKSLAVIFSAMCLGILSGSFVSLYLFNYASLIVLFGNITMIAAATVLLFIEKRVKKEPQTVTNPVGETAYSHTQKSDYQKTEHFKARLSAKEYEVLLHIMEGITYKEIAKIMNISESTIKTHVKRIFEKEKVSDRKSLIEKVMSTHEDR